MTTYSPKGWFDELVFAYQCAVERCILCKLHNEAEDTRADEIMPAEDLHECHQEELKALAAMKVHNEWLESNFRELYT